MIITKTFDEVFDQLYYSFKGKWIQIQIKKEGLILSDFTVCVTDLEIRPLEDRTLLKKMGLSRKDKLGSMVIKGTNTPGGKVIDCLNIPFKLGFDTVNARFTKANVSIGTCGFEFKIKQVSRAKIS